MVHVSRIVAGPAVADVTEGGRRPVAKRSETAYDGTGTDRSSD